MKTSKTIFLLLMVFVFLFFTGAACVKVEGEARRGIFKSVERADRWFQKTSLLSLKAGENIGSVNATVLEFDPLDSGTLYLGTKEHGLFLSINAGDSWQKIERLPQGKIKAILPHPKNSAEVYVAVDQKIFRSGNCCRTWENLYLETKEKVEVTALAIDPFFNQIIYAGLSDGRLIKSENRGYGWNLVNEFKAEVKQILVNPQNPSILYVVISNGFFKSEDKGKTWLSLGEFLKDYSGATQISKALFVPQYSNSLILGSSYGLLLSSDGGRTWSAYKLLSAPGKAPIESLVLDPYNPNVIYYTALTTLYKTIDGGNNWITRSLPSKEKVVDLKIDPVNPNILYLIYQKKPKTYGF